MGSQEHKINETHHSAALDDQEVEYRMDGGLQAWLQLLGSWLLFANTWGLANSYGAFETYYIDTYLTTSTPSAISWIGSIQLFLTMFVGVLAGRILDAGYLRPLLIGGSVIQVFGMFMTSLSTEYWQVLLAQGICAGLGSGLLGLTSVAVIPLYFERRKMLATGIAATGSSLGSFVRCRVRYCTVVADYRHSGNLLPDHAPAAVCASGISVGCESSDIRHAGLSDYLLCGDEASASAS
ncbi:Major Facilitator Superfamily [Aspergillus sclerotialis]|uniref:Major Facilitator Superfamily n=1 Tax=Aspergillus sclerotialis TaxID=2070753 RepID=A0A3A2Z9Q4_9EURO|nr:Major Facilitator Superfamily [Aspergillus sclerotialis]